MFSINLVTLDSYQSIPIPELDVTFSNFRGNEIKQVPVIRIFGSTISGIKTCVHIHGVFPYLYIPCIVNNNTDSFMYKLAAAIDSAINVSLGSAVSNTQHIYKIQQVSGIPLYGYHEKEHLFFKIYFYNPVMIKRAADLLQNGTILNQSLQPHEAHIPFILQFMIDYNLYGMSLINLKNVKFRQCIHTKSKENFQNESLLNLFDSQNFLPASILNQSICKLEVDAQAYEILNKQEIHNGIDLNPGIATIWNEEKYRRKAKCLQSVESQLLYTNIEDRIYDLTENDIYQEKRLIERLKSASQINENVTPLISKTSNYPLEVENEDNSFGALRVSNHFKSSELNKQNKNETSLNNDLLEFEKSVINESLHQDKTIENSILDSEDMYLVEILADLVEETEENKIVDNDSMLGSQFSMLNDQIKEDNEDDEIEDLNITSLDLDSLSSWNSIITENETKENEDYKKTDCKTEHNTESTSLMDFPQYDGSNDMILKCEKQLSKWHTKNEMRKKKKVYTKLKKYMLHFFNNRSRTLNEIKFISIQINFNHLQNELVLLKTIMSDIILPKYFTSYQTQIPQFKSKHSKIVQINRRQLSCYNNMNLYKLDHQDLDVYDVDEIENTLTINNYKHLKHTTDFGSDFNQMKYNKSFYMINSILNKLNTPALDGNIIDSSSDSDLDQDITVNKEERCICVLKSCMKSKSDNNVINISLNKRKHESENPNLQSLCKRRNIIPNYSQNEPYHTPTKLKTVHNSCPVSKKYSPLNIKIISPKKDKSTENNESCSSKVSSTTLKWSNQHLKMNSFHEKINNFILEANQTLFIENKTLNTNSTHTIIYNKHKDSTNTEEKLIDLEKKDNALRTDIKTQVICKNNKDVRKRLSFVNTNIEEISPLKDNTDKYCFNKLSLREKILNDTDKSNDSAISFIMNSIDNKNSIQSDMKEDEKVNYKHDLPSTSKTNVHLYVDNVSNKISLMNRNTDEGNIYNMTYTQYLNRKLEFELNTSNITSLESTSGVIKTKLIIITTKFNPPSKERIINSMKTYNILTSKYSIPFFSNKVDFIKFKQGGNLSNSIYNITPFKCSLDRITGINLWRRVKINEFYPSGSSIKSCNIKKVLAGFNVLIIHSIIQPPTLKNVKIWLQTKKYLLKKNSLQKGIKDNIDILKNAKEDDIFRKTPTDNHSQYSNNLEYSNRCNSFNFSLRKILENPLLYKNNDTQHPGISCGQIEYSLKEYSGGIENENVQNAKGLTVHQYLTILAVEIHIITRDKLLPDPDHDPIEGIFYAIYNDVPLSQKIEQIEHGAILVNSSIQNSKVKDIHSTSTCITSYVSSEEDLLNSLIILVRHCDPDILIGWEIESLSWGYIFHRASVIGLHDFTQQISRILNTVPTSKKQISDKNNFNDVKIPGRIILDVWRIMRHEVALLSYTFENVMYNVMHERISCPTFKILTAWWNCKNVTIQWRIVTHYIIRVVGTLRILIHLDIIGRTCEHARLFGIQFYEVFSRGSQFRVESMMLRLAKPLNYIAVSPSIQQRARMRAPESLPLIMEPQSAFYTDPLIVLDFQSLYPSIIIAYNYCFSTCLGRVEHIGHYEPYEFGATTLKIKKDTVKKLLGKINFAPCGVAFVKPEIRMGILPRMLTEILNTRIMVKESMKLHGNKNHTLQRILHSQQLGLKLIANVTYGYTAANFSGRMPCIEIGDSVVSKGRETLEQAIKIIESTPKWGAEVVYGDTDSLFILLRGKTRKDAFAIGAEIANTITAANPPPIKLKFEKVLQPSILQTKKRYCGYMYESPDQKEPEYLAKGIETVRRDGCPAVAKILEKTLKILFDTKDLSLVKLYVTRQFDKILRKKISLQDLTFAKEFRGLHGYKTSACVPALELTRRLMRKDPREIPRTGERVRYIIVAGAPNQPLIQCVRTPIEVISDEGLTPNSIYYITKVIIPPLNRCLNLINIDTNAWYREMIHRETPDKVVTLCMNNQKQTIRQFFSTVVCAACGNQTQRDICINCVAKPSQTVTILHEKLRWLERTHHELTMMCQCCTGYLDEPKCESLDCPVLYRLMEARRDLVQIPYLHDIINNDDNFSIERRNIGKQFVFY
ncbi:PREDICTED: DNA polymerase zeta catalytic subunit [Eufriesea mexicana]|uniref:DNA polymerase zeta catalytic subunit n=1 Tax=Eufriesea mexicana TaxID=516756 RepID=UPI00083C4B25|nr:PREDICTED: DNA polymerase zeta catalytic subunit [Eufriesea mexicana]